MDKLKIVLQALVLLLIVILTVIITNYVTLKTLKVDVLNDTFVMVESYGKIELYQW